MAVSLFIRRSLFLMIQLKVSKYWFRWQFGVEQAGIHGPQNEDPDLCCNIALQSTSLAFSGLRLENLNSMQFSRAQDDNGNNRKN